MPAGSQIPAHHYHQGMFHGVALASGAAELSVPIADRWRTAAALNVVAHSAWFHTFAGRRQERHWRTCNRFSARRTAACALPF